jgi:DNA-binding transcriptional ArsR family regulator
MNCKSYNTFFETISSKIRLNIIETLEDSPKSVSEICSILNEEQSKISHNLRHLMDCHFLDVQRKGKQRIYSLNKATITPLMKLVKKHVETYCCDVCNNYKK